MVKKSHNILSTIFADLPLGSISEKKKRTHGWSCVYIMYRIGHRIKKNGQFLWE